MLKVKKLDPRATLPTVAHPGEDLAYDIYALENVKLDIGEPQRVRTGIAAQAFTGWFSPYRLGMLIRDRSSMATKGIFVSGGVIDHGYTGEIMVVMTSTSVGSHGYEVKAGDKIAQMIPIPILTGPVTEVEELGESSRGNKGFGSTGR